MFLKISNSQGCFYLTGCNNMIDSFSKDSGFK